MSYIRWFNLLQIASCIPLFAIGVRINTDDDFIFEQDFNQPDIGNDFVFSDPAAWRIQFDNKNGLLELVGNSSYTPPHRSPLNIALIGTHKVSDFVLEADLLQTGREYGHRDMCIFFGFQNPAHFYYVHIAAHTDDHAHNIFVVDGSPRTKISTKTTIGVDWGGNKWHHIKVERLMNPAVIKVYFDDMTVPIMVAEDDRFDWGYVGFGSFDDSGYIDNIRITAPNATKDSATFFEPLQEVAWKMAADNGRLANEALSRCQSFVDGWMQHRDPETGLIPRNLRQGGDFWNAADAAADNYPFMVLTTSFTDSNSFEGEMLEILKTEIKLTSRVGALPDDYSFSKRGFRHDKVDMGRLIFGASEYVKDGLLPMTEWLGNNPWSKRMISITDAIWDNATIATPFGVIPSTNVEVNGELLQALSRIYWMTGEDKYLDWAIRLGNYYLLGDHHPTRDFNNLKLRDHGCEIVSGLSELYVACHFARPEKAQLYQAPIHEMLDRILEVGRNEHGMLYNSIAPGRGEVTNRGLADTWGYNYNAFYAVYLIDKVESYRDAVLKVLSNLNDNYRSYRWEGESADGYADSIEGALNLYNREPIESVADWIDSEMQVMFTKQQPDGVIEGWHGDGNFARTALMYALWKTQGLSIHPWRPDIRLGGVEVNGNLYVTLEADEDWEGRVVFDTQRHRLSMHLPLDYPRINQFPEWWTVDSESAYEVSIDGTETGVFSGRKLIYGLPMTLREDQQRRLIIKKKE